MESTLKDKKTMYILAAVLISAFSLAILSTHFMGDDNMVEETAETIIENELEDFLDLKENQLKNKIDFSYQSKEV